VQELLERNEQRRAARRQVWREHSASARAREAAYQRMTEQATPEHGVNRDAGLEL
jgi:hypothetical protein